MGELYVHQYAIAGCVDLTPNALRVLFRMAAMCMDTDADGIPEGVYFGGWHSLGPALGYGVIREYDEMPKQMENAAGRAIKELVTKGYISVAPRHIQKHHRRRVYQLHLTHIFDGGAMTPRYPNPHSHGQG
jgi:hypothetical protein